MPVTISLYRVPKIDSGKTAAVNIAQASRNREVD